MHHLVLFHTRLTQPIVLKFRSREDAETAQQNISKQQAGELWAIDHIGQIACMPIAELAATLLVDYTQSMAAAADDAIVQNRAQQSAQQRAAAGPRLVT